MVNPEQNTHKWRYDLWIIFEDLKGEEYFKWVTSTEGYKWIQDVTFKLKTYKKGFPIITNNEETSVLMHGNVIVSLLSFFPI